MKFKCIDCNFECKFRSDYERHTKTDKHLNKILNTEPMPKIYEYTHKSTHKQLTEKDYLKQIDQLSQKIEQYKTELTRNQIELANKCNELKEEKYQALEKLRNEKDLDIKQKDLEIKALTDKLYQEKVSEVKELKNVANPMRNMSEDLVSFAVATAATAAKENIKISAFSYARKFFRDCPPIKNFEETNLLGEDDIAIAENAIYAMRKKNFHIYIGDVIIKVYKKDDCNTQSLWSSDINRLAYILRTKLNEQIDWVKDDKGLKTSEHIIVPALEYIRTAVVKYQKNLILTMTDENTVKSLKSQEYCAELIRDIDNNLYTSPILKYIAASFKLNVPNINYKSISNEPKCLLKDKSLMEIVSIEDVEDIDVDIEDIETI